MKNVLVPILVAAGLIAGFSREILLGYFFGVSLEIEIFRVAFGLPSILSDGLAVSLVAILIRLTLGTDVGKPAQALHRAVWATTAFAVLIFLIGVLTMPWQAQFLAPGMSAPEQARLTLAGRVSWFMFLFVVLSLPMRALMSTRGRVWPGAASQLMRSGGFVLALLVLVLLFGWRDLMTLVVAAAIGGATVLTIHILALGRRDRHRIAVTLMAPPHLTELLPTLVAIGLVLVSQLFLSAGRILDRAVSSGMGEGTLAGLEYSYALIMAVAAVLATSSNLILAPRMGRAIRDTGRLACSHAVQIAAIAAAAAALGGLLALAAEPITRLAFQRGAFDAAATALTSGVFRLHAIALGPLILSLLLTQVLLLHGRQRIALTAAVFKTAVKLVSLWLVLRNHGDIFDVAKTLIWTEAAMSIFLIVIVSYSARQRFSGRSKP